MFEIAVEARFKAAHFLKLYDGVCERRHAHTWKVSVRASAKRLDEIGVVADFEVLKRSLRRVLSQIEGGTLNQKAPFMRGHNPSAENVAKWIYQGLIKTFPSKNAKISAVTVWEMPGCSATFFP